MILHQAAMKSVPRSIEEPEVYTDVNVLGTLHVLLAARDERAAVVFASSSSVYGDQDRFPLTEDLAPGPLSPYAASKLAGEGYLHAWWESYRVPTVALRYFNVYGPGQDPASEYAAVVTSFVTACLTGSRPVIHGDGEQSRDFTYVEDVAAANLLAARAPASAYGRVFNIGGGGEPTSINRLLELIAAASGASPDPLHEPPRAGDIRRSHADMDLARRVLGFEPAVGVDEGLRRTVEWFRGPRRRGRRLVARGGGTRSRRTKKPPHTRSSRRSSAGSTRLRSTRSWSRWPRGSRSSRRSWTRRRPPPPRPGTVRPQPRLRLPTSPIGSRSASTGSWRRGSVRRPPWSPMPRPKRRRCVQRPRDEAEHLRIAAQGEADRFDQEARASLEHAESEAARMRSDLADKRREMTEALQQTQQRLIRVAQQLQQVLNREDDPRS